MFRQILRKSLRTLGFDGMERDRFDRLRAAERAATTYPRILRDFFHFYATSSESIYLLHVGANDGVKDDFNSFMRQSAKVMSILVEPQRHCFAKLSAIAHQNQRISVLSVAFGETDGETTLYRFDRQFENGIQLDVFSSFDRRMLEDKKRYFSLAAEIVGERVETCTLRTLLVRGGAPRMDILICDIEGLDHLVIAQLVATIRPLPVIIVFEQRWLTAEQRRKCYDLLDEQGYGILHGTEDAWCYRFRSPQEFQAHP